MAVIIVLCYGGELVRTWISKNKLTRARANYNTCDFKSCGHNTLSKDFKLYNIQSTMAGGHLVLCFV